MLSRIPYLTLLVALHLACGGSGTAATTTTTDTDDPTTTQSDTTTAPPETTGDECTPGYEGCACHDGECLGDLTCASNLCVALPSATESSGDDETTSALDDSSTSEAPDDTSTGDEPSSSESSTTAVVETCRPDDVSCVDGVLETCVDEARVETMCADQCAVTGYMSEGCADDESCSCTGWLDQTCADGTNAFCFCVEFFEAGSCTVEDFAGYYEACYADDPDTGQVMECFAGYIAGNQVDCNAAANACI